MAAITYPITGASDDETVVVGGAAARAAAVRSRDGVRRRRVAVGAGERSPFSGNGQLRRPKPPVRLTSVPLVAHDDLASLPTGGSSSATPGACTYVRLATQADPGRTARPADSATASRPSTATYRRRRLVVAALFLGALLTVSWALSAFGGGSLAASESATSSTATVSSVELHVQPVSRSTYVVTQGDTLWSIARALQPEGDVRPVVDALAATRQGRPLEAGETIVLP